jgi:hypothetical protein
MRVFIIERGRQAVKKSLNRGLPNGRGLAILPGRKIQAGEPGKDSGKRPGTILIGPVPAG